MDTSSVLVLLVISLVLIGMVESEDGDVLGDPRQIQSKGDEGGLYGPPHPEHFDGLHRPSPRSYGESHDGGISDYPQESIGSEFYVGPDETYYRNPKSNVGSPHANKPRPGNVLIAKPLANPQGHHDQIRNIHGAKVHIPSFRHHGGYLANPIFDKDHGRSHKPNQILGNPALGGHLQGNKDYEPLFAHIYDKTLELISKVPLPARKFPYFKPVKPIPSPVYGGGGHSNSKIVYDKPLLAYSKLPILAGKPLKDVPHFDKSYLSDLLLGPHLNHHRPQKHEHHHQHQHQHHDKVLPLEDLEPYHDKQEDHPLEIYGPGQTGHAPHPERVRHLGTGSESLIIPSLSYGYSNDKPHHHLHQGKALPLPLDPYHEKHARVPLEIYSSPAHFKEVQHIGPVSGISIIPSLSYGYSQKIIPESLLHPGGVKTYNHGAYYGGGHGGFDLLDKAVAHSAVEEVPAILHGLSHGPGHHEHTGHHGLKAELALEEHYEGLGYGNQIGHYHHHH